MKMKNILRFPRQLLLGLICWLNTLIVADNVHAAFGDILAQYTFPASSLVMLPGQPLMYATIPSQNSVAIINTNTLVVVDTVFVGSGPTNLAFSPDGSKAYIANNTSNFVAVFDTQSRTVINSFLLPEHPQDVVFGNSNRLWVLGDNSIFQIDATTGNSTGPSITNSIFGGSLEISPDRNTLYYADLGLDPGSMYKYDVTGITPVLLLQTPFGMVGSNGQDLTLSHSGSFICYTTGSGNTNYDIAKFRTSDFAELGSFYTGPYPRALAFSPDDLLVYASVNTASGIKAFDANTFLLLGTITGPDVASKLTVDSTGGKLFAGYNNYHQFLGTIVFDIGRTAHPSFFSGEVSLGNGVYYLQFPNGTPFGYYSYLTDQRFIYHFDMGFEYWFDANDGQSGIFFYDFMSNHFFYTSPSFPFPYLYDFSLNTVLYYYPDQNRPGHYTTNPRYFYNFATGQIITM
jgi:YVTN family beta-propeller protein